MANRNPWQARLARALRCQPGSIDDIKRRTWGMLCLAYEEVGACEDVDQRRKAMLAYSQLAASYLKL